MTYLDRPLHLVLLTNLVFADDSDTDGHMDSWDNCWTVPNDQKDTNGNGKGDACGMASMGRTGLTETGIGQQT